MEEKGERQEGMRKIGRKEERQKKTGERVGENEIDSRSLSKMVKNMRLERERRGE